MLAAPRTTRAVTTLAVLGVAAVIALSVVLRLADPLSTRVIPAEDPYTHMALVREHLREGSLNPMGTKLLYPPGLHGFLSAAWVYTGVDLYEIIRVGPAVMGAIGVLGIALLLWRQAGPVAAFVGAMALAVAPEAIFRTTMMSPTAMDLAVLPFLLYALFETMQGRLAWAFVAAPVALFLVYAHPWLFAILGGAGLALVVLALALPWPTDRYKPLVPAGIAASLFLIGGGLALTLTTCGGYCGPGFRDLLPNAGGLEPLAWGLLVLAVVPLALVLLRPRSLDRLLLPAARPRPLWIRIGVSALFVVALLAITLPALAHGLPEFVNLPHMLGWPILLLAAFGFAALPFVKSPAAYLGAAIAVPTYPMVMYNLLDSPFWPHRTVVFLCVGLALLAGSAAGALARWTVHTLSVAVPRWTNRPHLHARPALVLVPAMFAVACLGGTVYAATPDGYPGGWYRMYHACDLDALEAIAHHASAEPTALVITGDWESKLVLAALTDDASRIWISGAFFTHPEKREDLMAVNHHKMKPIIVVVERYLRVEQPAANTTFLDDPRWIPLGNWCSNMGVQQPRVLAYEFDPRIA